MKWFRKTIEEEAEEKYAPFYSTEWHIATAQVTAERAAKLVGLLLVIAASIVLIFFACGCVRFPGIDTNDNRHAPYGPPSRPLYPETAPTAPAMPRAVALSAPQNLTASDPCVTRWGKPCATNSNNTYTGKFLLKWDYFENVPGVVFVVRSNSSPDFPVKLWAVAAITSNKFYALPEMGVAGFFAVTASNPVLKTESDFAR